MVLVKNVVMQIWWEFTLTCQLMLQSLRNIEILNFSVVKLLNNKQIRALASAAQKASKEVLLG